MASQARAAPRLFAEMPKEWSDFAAPMIQFESEADIARSERNILQWMAYLPDECIKTMILMGWDVTT